MPDEPVPDDHRSRPGSWLDGSAAPAGAYPGSRLGLPDVGPGSLARLGRRVVALCIDWALASAISAGFFAFDPTATLALFAAQNVLLVGTLGHTIGHRILGLTVRLPAPAPGSGDRPVPGPLRALARTVLLCLVIPAVVWDGDGRGLHDRAAGTVLLRR